MSCWVTDTHIICFVSWNWKGKVDSDINYYYYTKKDKRTKLNDDFLNEYCCLLLTWYFEQLYGDLIISDIFYYQISLKVRNFVKIRFGHIYWLKKFFKIFFIQKLT